MIIDDALETSASVGAELLAVGADFSFDLLNSKTCLGSHASIYRSLERPSVTKYCDWGRNGRSGVNLGFYLGAQLTSSHNSV